MIKSASAGTFGGRFPPGTKGVVPFGVLVRNERSAGLDQESEGISRCSSRPRETGGVSAPPELSCNERTPAHSGTGTRSPNLDLGIFRPEVSVARGPFDDALLELTTHPRHFPVRTSPSGPHPDRSTAPSAPASRRPSRRSSRQLSAYRGNARTEAVRHAVTSAHHRYAWPVPVSESNRYAARPALKSHKAHKRPHTPDRPIFAGCAICARGVPRGSRSHSR